MQILVIPVAFSNQPIYDGYKELLEIGFNGTSADTGWESLNSYYYKTSFGKLNINATILDAYQSNIAYDETDDGEDEEYGYTDYRILQEAIEYYDSSIDYSLYDSNNDGYIDCIYLVYLAPYSDSDLYWAYTNTYSSDDIFDNKQLYTYMWLSIEFFNEDISSNSEISDSVTVNCETLIHETGHALGLDDYYDTKKTNRNGGYGSGVMMDYNTGDHDSYSKAILGWIDPWVVTNTNAYIELSSFALTGDSIFIAKDWNGSYFGEFYIVDFYTPEGLNELTAGERGKPSISGIRISHLDSTLKEVVEYAAYDVTKYNNSNNDHMLISIVEADQDNSILLEAAEMDNSDLWQAGESISLDWYDGSFACRIYIDQINEKASVRIEISK